MKTPLILLCCSGLLPAQFVTGDVYDSITSNPIAGVSVSTSNGVTNTIVKSDAGGHFQIAAASANVSLKLSRHGYLDVRMTGRAERILRVALIPEAVIAGKVEDEDGFPVSRAYLRAMGYRTVNGKRKLVYISFAQTNDRGEYRIDGLSAGRYYLDVESAGSAANWDQRYVRQFRGGTLEANEQQAVEVKAGEIRSDIPIRLAKHQGVTLSGSVKYTGAAVITTPLFVTLERDFETYSGSFMYISKNEFTIRHVPPGEYTLRIQSSNGPPKIGDLTDSILLRVGDTDLQNLVLHPQPLQGVELSGKVTLQEGGDPGLWTIRLNKSTGGAISASTLPDDTFVIEDLLPGHYGLNILPDFQATLSARRGNLHPISVRLRNAEVLRTGIDVEASLPSLDVTVTEKLAKLTGVLLDAQAKPIADQPVYFCASPLTQAAGFATTDADGRFQASVTVEGTLHVYAVDTLEMQRLGEEDYFQAHGNDFPVVRVVFGDNAPVILKRK